MAPIVPFEDSLGLRITRRHKDGVTLEIPIRPDLLNGQKVMHGGVLAAIADEAAWHAILHCLGEKRNMTTTELKMNYLRPIAGVKIVAKTRVVKTGRTLCVAQVDLYDTRRQLGALGVVTYMLL